MIKAYIDIETTGLSPTKNEITIVGILIEDTFIQFGPFDRTNRLGLIEAFLLGRSVTHIVGFNHERFDLPFLYEHKYLDLKIFDYKIEIVDLMHTCHDLNLKGGLKKVEQILGIERKYEVLNFFQQKALWQKYINNNDRIALDRLLKYNEDDVKNLPVLEKKLNDKIKKQEEKHEIFKKAYFKKLNIKME